MFQNTNNATQSRIQREGETTIVVGEKYCTTVTPRSDFFDSKCIKSVWRRDPQGQLTAPPQSPWLDLRRAVLRLAKTGKGGRGRNKRGAIPRSATAVTLTNALHTRACNQHSTFTSRKLTTGSPQNSPTKSRELCYHIYKLTAVLLGMLQVGPSLVDCSALETPHR